MKLIEFKRISVNNYIRCEKMLQIKIVGLEKVYKLAMEHFLIGITVFVINIETAMK